MFCFASLVMVTLEITLQGTSVRVTGDKKDNLQAAMALIKKDVTDLPLQFNNFRD